MVDTEINNNQSEPRSESSSGWIVAVVILLLVVVFLLFGLPYLQGGNQAEAPDNTDTAGVDIEATFPAGSPEAESGGPAE